MQANATIYGITKQFGLIDRWIVTRQQYQIRSGSKYRTLRSISYDLTSELSVLSIGVYPSDGLGNQRLNITRMSSCLGSWRWKVLGCQDRAVFANTGILWLWGVIQRTLLIPSSLGTAWNVIKLVDYLCRWTCKDYILL